MEVHTDIIIYILEFLKPIEILKLSLVNHTFNSCANSNFLWKNFYLKKHLVEPKQRNYRTIYYEKEMLDDNWFNGKPKVMEINCGSTPALIKFQKKDFYSDGSGVLASGLGNGEIRLWKIKNNEVTEYKNLKGGHNDKTVFAINFQVKRMGTKLISSGADSQICTWDMESGDLLDKFPTKQGIVWNVNFLDSTSVGSAGDNSTLKIFDIYKHNELHSFKHDLMVYDFATNDDAPTSNIIISTSQDQTSKLWDRRSNKCEATMSSERENFEINLFNSYYVTVGSYSLLTLFDLRKPDQKLDSIKLFKDNHTPVRGLHINSTRTVCGSKDEICILTRHQDVLKKRNIKEFGYNVMNTLSIGAWCLHCDDEYLISGYRTGVITIADFSDFSNSLRKKLTTNKNCSLQ